MTPVELTPPETPNALRVVNEEAVDILYEWLFQGRCEEGANNMGDWVLWLTNGRIGSWCAALQYRADAEAAHHRGWVHPIIYSRRCHSARWLHRAYTRVGGSVRPRDARVGDLVTLPRGLPHQGHSQRISRVHDSKEDGSGPVVSLIDGNVGSYRRTRGRVREVGPVDLRRIELVGIARLW